MRVEDIVEGLNRHIEEIRRELGLKVKGHIVLHRTIEPCSIKAYKKYSAKLYYVGNKIKYLLGEAVIQDRILDGQEDKILSKVNIDLIQIILKFNRSELFDKVIRGENYDRNE